MFLEDPYEKIEKFRREMEKVFNRYMREVDILTAKGDSMPRFNLKEEKQKYIYEIEVPGVNKEDIEINILEDSIEVKATKKKEKKEKKENYLHIETSIGNFYRVIPLPEDADIKSVKASYSNGIVRLEFKKKKSRKARKVKKIKIQ